MTLARSSTMDTPGAAAEVVRELVRRRADLVEHARGSLRQHLLGVHAVLSRWGQPERVRLAGLVHSAYSTEAFRTALFERDERSRLRELVGADAERLVFAFCGCRREALLEAAEHDGGAVRLTTRWDGATVSLERRDLAELMVIHAANLADQTGRPTPWLSAASRFLAAARADREVAPPVLGGGTVVVTPADEAALGRAYRALLRGEESSGEVVRASPVGEPLVLAGLRARAARRGAGGAARGQRGRAAFDAWGVPWDKRLGLSRWRQLAALLARDGRTRDRELDAAARRARAAMGKARGSPSRIWTSLDALEAFGSTPGASETSGSPPEALAGGAPTAEGEGLPPRFATFIGGLRTNTDRPLLRFYPGLRAQPWHDPHEFPIVADLERHASQIADEARGFAAGSFQDEAENIGRTGRWSVLFLVHSGRLNEANLARCPALASIVARHQALLSHAGSMYFSCLDPRTRVAAHLGPTNLRVRCHLGLEVPEGCGVRVGGVASQWQEGRCVVFDDSFSHEVWNDSDRRRVILVLDLWHPDLTGDEIALLAGLERYGAASAPAPRRDRAREPAPAAAPAKDDPVTMGTSPPNPVSALRRAVAESPGDARAHLLLGHELSLAGHFPEAEQSFRAVLAIDPSLAMAHNNLGWVRQMADDTEGAIAAYERALALDASCGRARRNLASLLVSRKRYGEALALREADALADPGDMRALSEVVGVALRASKLEAAAEYAARSAAICRGTRWYPVRRDDAPALPAGVTWNRVLTPGKLLHDIEQLEYLQRRGVFDGEITPILHAYEGALDTLRPLGPEARVPLDGALLEQIGHVYNRILHVRETPRVARALSPGWRPTDVEDEFLAKRPGVVVIDDFLSEEALASLRAFCLESTVWSENRYNHGRLGSMFQEGFNCPLLVQIAEEVQAALPRVLRPEIPVRQIWGYKYASSSPKETPHADFAQVNVNVWITPDDANLDPSSGGLDVYDVASPDDWDFSLYNNNEGVRLRAFLAEHSRGPRHIPYRYNRATIFESAMFHGTPAFTFRSGYENRRMNVTVLFGARHDR